MTELGFIGDGTEESNWIDFRDLLKKHLDACDTELKLNKFIFGIVLSVCPSPETLIEGRRLMGMHVSMNDAKKIKEMYKDACKK